MNQFETPSEHIRNAFIDMTPEGMAVDKLLVKVAETLLGEFETWDFKYRNEIHSLIANLNSLGIVTVDTILHTMRQTENPYSESDTRFVYHLLNNDQEKADKHLRSIFIDNYIGEDVISSMCQRAMDEEELDDGE